MAYQYDIPFHVDLSDRVALVTGGNGGIGGMFCRALAACGATVIILANNLERCQQLAAEINAGYSARLFDQPRDKNPETDEGKREAWWHGWDTAARAYRGAE